MESEGLFGEDTELLKSKLVDTIRAAHLRHVETQRVSGQVGQSHYGLIWKSLPVDCVAAVQKHWVRATTVHPGRAGYQLPVLQGTVIFPWRPRGGGDPDTTPFVTGPSRAGLWALSPDPQGMLELGDLGADSPDAALEDLREVVELAEAAHLRVVIVAVESDVSRLRQITWGVAEPALDGTVRFVEPETLYVGDDLDTVAAAPATAATPIITAPTVADAGSTPDERTFATGTVPNPVVRKRPTGTDDK